MATKRSAKATTARPVDLYVPEPEVLAARYSKAVPREAHMLIESFAAPPGIEPADPRSMVYRAFQHLAHSLAERLPNSAKQIKAIEDLHVAMTSAVEAMDDGNRV